MSKEYDEYLKNHRDNVAKAYDWLVENLPDLFTDYTKEDYTWNIKVNHDYSKESPEEYQAYDNYFYGRNKSYQVVQDFNRAWLHHIHHNPHHWQHWIIHNDESGEGMKILDMDHVYIIEMICDWWSFSWVKGDLHEIFDWYDQRKDYMKLSPKTRKTVESILDKIKNKLQETES